MKKTINLIIKPLLILVLIAFTGCDKDLYEDSIQNSTREMHVREISLKDIEKRVSTRIKGEIKKVKNMKYETTGEGNRIEYNSELDIYIDTDNGNLVSVDGKDFYTFPMFKDDDDKIENVLFVDNGNGEMDTYLIKYNVKPEEFDNLTNEQIQDIDAEYQKIFWSGGEYVCFTWSSSTTVYPDCPYPNGTHSNGAQCDGEIQVSSATLCTWVEDFGSGNDGQTGGGDVGGVGGDTSGGGTTGGTSSGNTIHTGIGTSPELIKLKGFLKSLPDDLENWYYENESSHQTIQVYLDENNYSDESQEFVYEAIDALRSDGEVDFVNRIIINESLKNNPCLYGVFTQLKNSPNFQNYLSNFDGNFSVANLSLSVGVSPDFPGANAVTSSPQNYLISIMFNPNNLNRPRLDVARTFIHEIIHAEIFRKLLSCANLPNLNTNNYTNLEWENYITSLQDNFPGLYDYYVRYLYNIPAGQQATSVQHELMAQHYRDIIIQAMQQFDSSQTLEVYNALSWTGLMGEGNINPTTGLPPNPTKAWENLTQSERFQILSITNNFLTSEVPCQP